MTTTTKANTTKTVNQSTKSNAALKKELDAAAKAFDAAPMKDLAIPKVFQKSFGAELYISINGTFLNIPVDGTPYPVPEPFYNHAMRSINGMQ